MKELSLNDVAHVSGGYDNNGYNFTNIIESAVIYGVLGFGLFGLNFATCAAVGATFASAMLVTNLVDNVVFSPDTPVIYTSSSVAV
jgi:hypothetical protein